MKFFNLVFFFFIVTCTFKNVYGESFYDKHPIEDDIVVPLPCNQTMTFRKVYTKKYFDEIIKFNDGIINSTNPASEGSFICNVRGDFEDEMGNFYLIAKYELMNFQYDSLRSILNQKCNKTQSKTALLPKVNISHSEAREVASLLTQYLLSIDFFLSYRDENVTPVAKLPSSCAWSYAARGGINTGLKNLEDKIPSEMLGNVLDFAWVSGPRSSNGKLQIAGLLKPNSLGLYDMFGNAREMMDDYFRVRINGEEQGEGSGIVVRGGGFRSPEDDIYSAYRREMPLVTKSGINRADDTGFRLMLGLPAVYTSLNVLNEINGRVSSCDSSSKSPTIVVGNSDSSSDSLNQENFIKVLFDFNNFIVFGIVLIFCIKFRRIIKNTLKSAIASFCRKNSGLSSSSSVNSSQKLPSDKENIPTSLNTIYYKKDEDGAFISKTSDVTLNVIAASLRGVNHAKSGLPRNDEVRVDFSKDSGWHVFSIAEGSDLSKYSRKGSAIACEISNRFCIDKINVLSSLDTLISDYIKGDREISIKKIKRILYDVLPAACLNVRNEILKESTSQPDRKPEQYSTSLQIVLCKKFKEGWFVSSFSVGLGYIGILNSDGTDIWSADNCNDFSKKNILDILDKRLFETYDDLVARIHIGVYQDFQRLFVLSNGFIKAYFNSSSALSNINNWHNLSSDIDTYLDFPAKQETANKLLMLLKNKFPYQYNDRSLIVAYK